MPMLPVNPTRMELTRLKKRLKTARRGHRLLKDKRDELMKQFLEQVRLCRGIRSRLEGALLKVHETMGWAYALAGPDTLEQALLSERPPLMIETAFRNIMSVNVPVYTVTSPPQNPGDNHPYGFLTTPSDLDRAIQGLEALMPELLKLAQLEKSTQLLALEIEKTRRRVNALEYVMIPQLWDTIRGISLKLDENERGNLTRLMKVKDLILDQSRPKPGSQDFNQMKPPISF